MHKQHEDQPFISLTNLSTWHRVPRGAVIPADTPYAYAYEDGITVKPGGHYEDVIAPDNSYFTYYTEHPIVASPLPTEEGAMIMVSGNEMPPDILLTRDGGYWFDRDGAEWTVKDITSWAPVTIGEVVVMP